MSAAWVAGSVRGGSCRAVVSAGGPALDLARAGTPGEALAPRGVSVRTGCRTPAEDVAAAQRAIAETLLLHLRLLAGWLPPAGVGAVRALAGWFELVNVEDRLCLPPGARARALVRAGQPLRVLALASRAQTPGDLRAALAASSWGDPGSEEPEDVHVSLRAAWARRVLAEAPEA